MPLSRSVCLLSAVCCLLVSGCAAPQYAVRSLPVPDESAWVRGLEQTISAYQARELQREGVRPVWRGERLFGFDLQQTVDRLSRVTERPTLAYRVFLLYDKAPNAVALADGRIYLTTGMLNYLASRGGPVKSRSDFQDLVPDPPAFLRKQEGGSRGRESELATIVGHELAHTVAQHLVKRYQQLQKQQLLMTVVGLGAAVAARGAGADAQQMGQDAQDIAGLISDVAATGYSQEQELEADQLGVRYCLRAGYDPRAALELLQDFARFDTPSPFLRTHPPTERRLEDLERYLTSLDEDRRRLLDAQKLYPVGSQSWKNLQRQLEELEGHRR